MYTCNFNMFILLLSISSTQSLNRVQLFATPWTTAHQASLSITNSWSPPKPMSIESLMPSNHLILFSSCPQSFPASGSFLMSQLFTSGAQSIGVSASVLPMNIQDWFPSGLTGLIFLKSKGFPRVFSNTTKASILQRSAFFIVQLSHPYATTRKPQPWLDRPLLAK